MATNIQEQFGDQVIGLFAEFARADLKPPDQLAKEEFSHVTDWDLRRALAQVFYGVRWIYKLGLALLTKNEERAAHVRAQIVDYAAVCEGLLSYCVRHAINKGYTKGDSFKWEDPDRKKKAIAWSHGSIEPLLKKRPLWWLIRVADDFGIVKPALAKESQALREQRNTVHITQRVAVGPQAYLNKSKKAFDVVVETIRQTKAWKATHP